MSKQSIALETCALKLETYERILDSLFPLIAERCKSAALPLLEDFRKKAGQMRTDKFYSFPKGGLSNQDQMRVVASVFDSLDAKLREHLAKHAH